MITWTFKEVIVKSVAATVNTSRNALTLSEIKLSVKYIPIDVLCYYSIGTDIIDAYPV